MKKERKSMKYVKPEVEIVVLDEEITTSNITITSNEEDVFDMGEL